MYIYITCTCIYIYIYIITYVYTCLQTPQPYHLTTDLWSSKLLRSVQKVSSGAQHRSFDVHLSCRLNSMQAFQYARLALLTSTWAVTSTSGIPAFWAPRSVKRLRLCPISVGLTKWRAKQTNTSD